MLTNETYEEALAIITDMTDELGELDRSVDGYIDLLKLALEEISVSLAAAKEEQTEVYYSAQG